MKEIQNIKVLPVKNLLKVFGLAFLFLASITLALTSCKNTSDKNTNSQHQKIISAVERQNKQAFSYFESNPKLALKIIDTSLSLSRKNKLIDAEIYALFIQGKCYRMLEQKNEAFTSITSSLQLSVDHRNNWYRTLNLIELAEIQFHQLNYKIADSILNEAEDFAKKNNYNTCLAAIYNNKAKISDNAGQKIKAIELYLKTADLFKADKNEKSLAIVYNNLSLLYRSIKNSTEALRFLKLATVLNKKNNFTVGLAECYNNLGVIYNDIDSLDKGFESYKSSQMLYKKMGRQADMAKSYLNMANILSKKNEFKNAEKYYDSSFVICKKYNLGFGLILNEINRGELYGKMGNHQQAVHLLNSGLEKVKKLNLLDIEIEIELLLVKSYKALGNTHLALTHLENHNLLKNSASGKEINKQINELQKKYNKVEQEAEIAQLNAAVLLEKGKIRLLIIFALSLSIVLLIISFKLILRQKDILYINRQVKVEHEKVRLNLELKNKELVTNALHLSSLTEFSNKLAINIQDIIMQTETIATKNSLTEILYQINNVVPQGAWKNFEIRFEQVHEVFIEILLKRYPDLSPAEIKICSFLRLNLTTKDIAILTHRSQRTIENQRNSIRKKMNLLAESNLESYLIKMN